MNLLHRGGKDRPNGVASTAGGPGIEALQDNSAKMAGMMRTKIVLLITHLRVLVNVLALLTFLPGPGKAGQNGWPRPIDIPKLPDTCRRPGSRAGDIILPFVIRKIPLGNVSFYAKGNAELDTAVRFSPDGGRLAVGTFLGRLKMTAIYEGKTVWEKKIAEGLIRQLDFSPDGNRLYLGEQSVDGFVYAMDAGSGKVIWRFRLANDLKSSAPPSSENYFGIYQLPGCYRLKVLSGGDILVLGIHAWGDYRKAESMTRLSRLWRLSPEGKIRWAFPSDGPMPMTMIYFDSDAAGRRVAVLGTNRAANTPRDLPYRPGSIYVLEGQSGKFMGQYTFEPLKPYFKQVWFWQSVSVGPHGKCASIGMEDGRTFLFDLETIRPEKVFSFGAPIVISGVPVSARATYTHLAADGTAYFQTANSSVPYTGTMQYVVSPPGPHPYANTINAVGLDGHVKWRFRSGHVYQNFWSSRDGRWLLTCVKREAPRTGREAGAMLFDTSRPGGGTSKLVYYYRVDGMTFFQADIARDGAAFALVEIPYKDPGNGMLIGQYQVHVVR